VISLRPCAPGDARALADIEAQSTQYPWSEQQYRTSLTGTHAGFAIERDQILLGHCIVMMVLDEAEILNIVISHAHQGTGLGSRLLGHVLQQLASQGVVRVFLEVRESNTVAQALYHRHGFVTTGLRKNYYPSMDGREHAILMEARL
jgi:ribosomal-protein-alanine N-acetyltransferase